MALRLEGLEPPDRRVVLAGWEALWAVPGRAGRAGEDYAAWAEFALLGVTCDPASCAPGAIACTGFRLGRRCNLAQRPRDVGPLEATLSIVHESMHWRYQGDGVWLEIPHAFQGRPSLEEMRRDWIYRALQFDPDALRGRLAAYL